MIQTPIILNASVIPTSLKFGASVASKADLKFSEEPGATPEAPKLKRFNLRAYTGGSMQLDTLPHPVVFDLPTMTAAATVPLLWDHSTSDIVGHSDSIAIDGIGFTGVQASGLVSGTGYRAKEVNATAGNGFPWQVSIGLAAGQLKFYKAGETFKANGREFAGPCFHALNGMIREISFCPIGADPNTLATLAASASKGKSAMTLEQFCQLCGIDPATLTPETTAILTKAMEQYAKVAPAPADPNAPANAPPVVPGTPAVVPAAGTPVAASASADLIRSNAVAEVNRITGINRLNATYGKGTPLTFAANAPAVTVLRDNKPVQVVTANRPIADVAIEASWSEAETEIQLLRASRNVNVIVGGAGFEGPENFKVLEAAISLAVNHKNPDKAFTPQVLDAAHKQWKRGIGLQEVLLEAAYIGGYTGRRSFRGNHKEILRAAFSMVDAGNMFANTVNKSLLEGYTAVDDTWSRIAAIGSVGDFKPTANYRGVGSFTFEILGPESKLPHGTLDNAEYTNQADTYGKMFVITRKMQYNDDLNVLGQMPRQLGRGGAIKLNKVFWTEFLNNSAFFAAGNNNISTGVFGITGVSAAEAVFRALKDPNGDYIMSTPKILLVPPLSKIAAQVLNSSQKVISGSGTTPAGEDNPWAGQFQVESSPYMSDSAYTGYSAVAYYLLADPNDVPTIEVVFLDGQRTPTVETADANFEVLGIQMRGVFDFGVNMQDPNGGVRSTGA